MGESPNHDGHLAGWDSGLFDVGASMDSADSAPVYIAVLPTQG